MSAFGLPVDARAGALPRAEPRSRLGPPYEGWSTLAILVAMLVVVGWAVDDARWAGFSRGGGTQTAFLPFALALGCLAGFVLAKSRLSALLAHLVASAIGAAYLLVTISGIVSTDPDLPDRLRALYRSAAIFANDLFVEGIRSAETSMFLLTIGTLAWGTGVFASFNVFRRHRPMPAVVIAGTVLLINVTVTVNAQYVYLVLFSLAAMLLLVRMNLMEQREGWLRRRIGDAGYVSGLFMRSGAIFVVVALVGALLLSTVASSAPLARFWRNADDRIVQWGNELNRIVGGVTGPARGPSGLFSSAQTIRGLWESSDEVAFTVATSDGNGYYWRGAVYDDFDGTTWQQLDRQSSGVVPAGSPILEPTLDFVADDEEGRGEVTATITAAALGSDVVLAPDTPFALDRDAEAFTNGEFGPFATIELTQGIEEGESYTVSSRVRLEGSASGGITGNQLAAAGTDYPDWVARYLELKPDAAGPTVEQVTDSIVGRLPADRRTPYHVASAVQTYLYSTGGFIYQTDVRNLCGNERLVDCFLRAKRGYCEYFATAMAVMLRTQGIPSRMALGFLPGRKLPTGEWEVDRGAAHAWVEVYFPDIGWIRFDPTPGNRENGQRSTVFVAGPPVAGTSPEPSGGISPRPTIGRGESDDPNDIPRTGAVPAGTSGTPGSSPLIVAIVLVGFVLLLALSLAMLARRRIRFVPGPEQAFNSVTRVASRFGYAPLPTQTVYEYAGTLADVVPRVAPELHIVARAKVEAAYAARQPEGEGLLALRAAWRRARTGLLRLALRRRRRRGPRNLSRPPGGSAHS
ncbi:MAG: DUF3488 domain-containing protein [Chloroflexi bacterium]|nr:DUF3488 domain-containing protein [Chloroflexota bacterium]